MLYLIHGNDSFRSRQKLNIQIENYKAKYKSGLNFYVFDCEENTDLPAGRQVFDDFKNAASSVSMFREKKLIVIKNISYSDEFQNKFVEYLGNLFEQPYKLQATSYKLADVFIIFYESFQVSPKDDFWKKIIKLCGMVWDFELLQGRKLEQWIVGETKSRGGEINGDAVLFLIEAAGSDTEHLSNEIDKLIAFKYEDKDKVIKKRDVEILISRDFQSTAFALGDAFLRKDKKNILKYFYENLAAGDDAHMMFYGVISQFRNLLLVKSADESANAKLDLHPYVIKKTRLAARNYKLEEIKNIYKKFFDVDLEIKTGKTDIEEAVMRLVGEL